MLLLNVKLAFIACVGRMADARNDLVVGGGFVSPYAQHDNYNHLFKPLPASNLPEFRTNCRPSQQQLRTTLALSSSTSALPPKMGQRSTNRVARSRDIINIPYNSCTISIRLSVRWKQTPPRIIRSSMCDHRPLSAPLMVVVMMC